MIHASLTKYKAAIITVLSSIVINYLVSFLTFLLVYKFSLLNHSSFFFNYVPSIIAMIAVLIFLYYRVGIDCLMFYFGKYTIISALVGILVSWWFLRSINKYFSENLISEEFSKMNIVQLIIGIVLIGIIAPTLEEIIIRGYFFQSIKDHLGTSLGWIMSVLLSLIIHLIGVTTLSSVLIIYLLGGIIIVTAVYQVGKIPAAIIVHGFINIYMFVVIK